MVVFHSVVERLGPLHESILLLLLQALLEALLQGLGVYQVGRGPSISGILQRLVLLGTFKILVQCFSILRGLFIRGIMTGIGFLGRHSISNICLEEFRLLSNRLHTILSEAALLTLRWGILATISALIIDVMLRLNSIILWPIGDEFGLLLQRKIRLSGVSLLLLLLTLLHCQVILQDRIHIDQFSIDFACKTRVELWWFAHGRICMVILLIHCLLIKKQLLLLKVRESFTLSGIHFWCTLKDLS